MLKHTVKRLVVYLGINGLVAVLFYLLSFVLILLGIYRLNAMVISMFFSPIIAWMVFPVCFWRPLSMRVILVSVACVLMGYAAGFLLMMTDVRLPRHLSGPVGFFNLLLYSLLPAIFFEWVNRFRILWVFPQPLLNYLPVK